MQELHFPFSSRSRSEAICPPTILWGLLMIVSVIQQFLTFVIHTFVSELKILMSVSEILMLVLVIQMKSQMFQVQIHI